MGPNRGSDGFMANITSMAIRHTSLFSVEKLVKKYNVAFIAPAKPTRPSLNMDMLYSLLSMETDSMIRRNERFQ